MLSTTAPIKNNTLLLLHRSRNATQEDIAPPSEPKLHPLTRFLSKLRFFARKKHLRNRKCFFQRNPPLRVGEILLRSVKYAKGRVKSLRRWVDFIFLSAKRKISQVRQHFFHILRNAKYITYFSGFFLFFLIRCDFPELRRNFLALHGKM